MAPTKGERWRLDDLTIDVGGETVHRGSAAIVVPHRSFEFLLALIRAAPHVLSVDALMERVWAGVFVNSETVNQRAKLLRDALGDSASNPRYFVARRGIGYQLLATPELLDSPPPGSTRRRPPRRRWHAALAAAVLGLAAVGAIGATGMWPHGPSATQAAAPRVAVLTFDNLSNDPADAFIARSIPEMVLNRLSSVRGLTVISRESSMISIAANAVPSDAGARLNATYAVKGSVQRSGAILRVTCFVVDTATGARLWSEYFDWPINRVYELQDRIADHVAGALESKVRGLGSLPPNPIPSRNVDAYLAYLKGTSLLGRFTVAETEAATAQFARAIRLDPRFAQAMVALYDAQMQGADLRKDDLGLTRARYQPLLDRALQLEPNSGPALFATAMWADRPAAERIELFRRAADRDPSNSRGLTAYAQFLDRSNILPGPKIEVPQPDAAKALLDKVLAIDPLSPRARFWAVQRRFKFKTPEEIEAGLAHELEIDPQNYVVGERYAFRRWMFHGETAEAIERMEKVIASDPQNAAGPNYAVAFYLDANDPQAARAVAASTAATRTSSRILLAQFAGDWRGAGAAALDRRGFLFNEYQNWNWPQAVRDYALQTRDYDRGAKAIAAHFDFDLARPRVTNLAQQTAATSLAHILIARGDRSAAEALLAQTVQWIDTHPEYGYGGVRRSRAEAMMLLGETDQALSDLRASVETGHDIRHWWYVAQRDPVWQRVWADPRFKEIVEISRKAAAGQRAKLDALRKSGRIPVRTA